MLNKEAKEEKLSDQVRDRPPAAIIFIDLNAFKWHQSNISKGKRINDYKNLKSGPRSDNQEYFICFW